MKADEFHYECPDCGYETDNENETDHDCETGEQK